MNQVTGNNFRSSLLGLCVAVAIATTGCATTDANNESEGTSKTIKGAGIGAAAGAVIGAMTSNKSGRAKGVLTGAAVGAAAGAGTGYMMDKQEAKMKEKMANSGVQVKRDGDTLNLVIPGNISFSSGSAALTPSFYPVLDKVAETLGEYPDTQVQIVGHTDSTGSADLNQRLSQNRASAVSLYLGGKNVQTSRMQSAGMGPSVPVASNATADGRAQNRRVEIKIIPLAKQAG
jgi:outer membrane protein OmpA-like peptidoglycan-associated protein